MLITQRFPRILVQLQILTTSKFKLLQLNVTFTFLSNYIIYFRLPQLLEKSTFVDQIIQSSDLIIFVKLPIATVPSNNYKITEGTKSSFGYKQQVR